MESTNEFNRAVFSKRLCYTRELAGFSSQNDFAIAIGIAKQTVNYYESGERLPNAEILFKMADCLGCSVDWLLGISDTLYPDNSFIEEVTGLSEAAIVYLSQCDFTKKASSAKHLIFNHLLSGPYIDVLVDGIQKAVEDMLKLAYPKKNKPTITHSVREVSEIKEKEASPDKIKKIEAEEAELSEYFDSIFQVGEIDERIDMYRFLFSKKMATFFDETAAALSKDYGEWLLHKKCIETSRIESAIREGAARGIDKT